MNFKNLQKIAKIVLLGIMVSTSMNTVTYANLEKLTEAEKIELRKEFRKMLEKNKDEIQRLNEKFKKDQEEVDQMAKEMKEMMADPKWDDLKELAGFDGIKVKKFSTVLCGYMAEGDGGITNEEEMFARQCAYKKFGYVIKVIKY